MKYVSIRFAALLTLVAMPHVVLAAGLAVTPAAISNTYSGAITLNITGLTNHEPVTVNTYFDANNNGSVDSGELLIDVFSIAESGVTTIGGITNINVPFDSNSATDAITTALSFSAPIENTVGQKVYQVLSPSGRFAPVSATFNVTNAALNQAVAGKVFAGGVPQAGVIVVALTMPNFNYAGAAASDSGGNYFLKLAPGSYAVLPAKPGFFTDQSAAAIVTLTNGMMATNNVFLTNATATISGRVYDSASSNGLGGVFLQFESDNLFGVAFSDVNGDYVGAVSSNSWSIKLDGSRIVRRAYMRLQGSAADVDTSSGSVSNVNLAMFKGNAMFYGRITNNVGAPIPNVSVGGNNVPYNSLEGEGFTDANGYYTTMVLVDTVNFPGSDVWHISPNNDNAVLANYIVSYASDVSLTNNQAYLASFSALPVTASISGRLQNNLGAPVSDVSVGAYAVIGGVSYNTAYVNTDTNGNYSLGAASGQWGVTLNCCGNEGLGEKGYYDPEMQHSVTIPPANQVMNITVYPIGTPYLSQPVRFPPAQFNFFLHGAPGSNYVVQVKTNLSSGSWLTLQVVSNLPGNFQYIQDGQATNSQRYYRALLAP